MLAGDLGIQVTVDPLIRASFSLSISPSSVIFAGTATLKMTMNLNDDTLDKVPSSFMLQSNDPSLNGLEITRDSLISGIPFSAVSGLGSFTVSAVGFGNGGTYTTNTASWTVTAPTLSASITVDKSRAKVGVPFTFGITISQGFLVGGSTVQWNFGDGTGGTSIASSPTSVQSVTKAYSSAGTYTITAVVQSAEGVTKTLSGTVSVGEGENAFNLPLLAKWAMIGTGIVFLLKKEK